MKKEYKMVPGTRCGSLINTTVFTAVLIVLFNSNAHCQASLVLAKVINENGPVPKATAQLFNNDSILIRSQLTNEEGLLKIADLDKGAYILVISFSGHNNFIKHFTLDTMIDLATIKLLPYSKLLEEVTITGKIPNIEFRKSLLIFNVDEKLRESSINAADLIKKAPGIAIKNDQVTLDGLSGILITINGRQHFSNTGESLNYLKALSSEKIKTVEINAYPSSKYDQSVKGIINIVLNKDDTQGINCTAQSYVNTGRYASYGASIDFNFRKERLNAYGTLDIGKENNYSQGNNMTFISSPVINSYSENSLSLKKPIQNYARLGFDYSIDHKSTLNLIASIIRKTQKEQNYYHQIFLNHENQVDSTIQFSDHTNVDYKRIFANFNYNNLLDSASNKSLNINVNFVSDKPVTKSVFSHSYFNADGMILKPGYILNSVLPNFVTLYGIVVDYTQKIHKEVEFTSGIKLVRSETNNDVKYDSLSGTLHQPDHQLSSHTRYKEDLYNAYINFERYKDRWGFQMGLRYELAQIGGQTVGTPAILKKSYGGFYPNFLARYNINELDQLIFTAEKAVARPNFNMLNPYIRYVSPTLYIQGNQFLKQYNIYMLSLKYVFKNKYTASLRYDNAGNYIPQTLFIKEDHNNIVKSTYANAGNLSGFQFTLNIPFSITRFWSINNYLNSFYTTSKSGSTLYEGLDYKNVNLFYQISQNLTLPKDYYIEITFGYGTPSRINQQKTMPLYTMDLNIIKSFFNDRLKCSMDITDIFFTNKSRGRSIYNDLIMNYYRTDDTRRIGITLSYDFGSRKIESYRQRQNGVENELSRIKN